MSDSLFTGNELWNIEDFPQPVIYYDKASDELRQVEITETALREVEDKLRGKESFIVMKALHRHPDTETSTV
jgi:hypothetical protein